MSYNKVNVSTSTNKKRANHIDGRHTAKQVLIKTKTKIKKV